MAKTSTPDPDDRVGNLSKIQEALGKGVRAALERHKKAQNPVATWKDGAVVWVQPKDIPAWEVG